MSDNDNDIIISGGYAGGGMADATKPVPTEEQLKAALAEDPAKYLGIAVAEVAAACGFSVKWEANETQIRATFEALPVTSAEEAARILGNA